MEEKRDISPELAKLLEKDIHLSKCFVEISNKFSATRTIRNQAKALEWSCHGIVWLALTLACIWMFPSIDQQLLVNLFFAMIIDIIVIALIKAATRRRRPSPSSSSMDIGPDKFSFPSGHASRAALIGYIFIVVYGTPWFTIPPLLAWIFSVSLARILAERHYILDVSGGLFLGVVEGFLYSLIFWFEEDTCKYIVNYLTEEKLSGGEYHV